MHTNEPTPSGSRKRIGVFCSANDNIGQNFFDRTRELGEWIGRNGHALVFGGTDMGLMDCVAQAVHRTGGQVIGVVPTLVEERGRTSRVLDVDIRCDNLSDRKDLLVGHSDVIVALPGGIGTLDEVFTVAAAATIGYHRKQVLLYNVDHFWDSLVALLDDLDRRGVMRRDYRRYILPVCSLDEIARSVENMQ